MGGGGGGFFFNDTATTEIYTLSLHDALPILVERVIEMRDIFKNDLESLNDNGKDKKKKKKNELEELENNPTKTSKLSDMTPHEVLPSIGVLFEKRNDAYLVIEYTEEIQEALKVSKKYHAKVVANGDE